MALAIKLTSSDSIKTIVLDIIAFSVIFFTPAISHLFSIPFYYLEPMRIMLILVIAHTNKKNAYFLAIMLPLFSFIISGHPYLLKTFLISGELLINVTLFYYLKSILKNTFISIFLSILVSKIVYYSFKFLLISALLIDGSLISTPLFIQMAVMFSLSLYIYFILDRKLK